MGSLFFVPMQLSSRNRQGHAVSADHVNEELGRSRRSECIDDFAGRLQVDAVSLIGRSRLSLSDMPRQIRGLGCGAILDAKFATVSRL